MLRTQFILVGGSVRLDFVMVIAVILMSLLVSVSSSQQSMKQLHVHSNTQPGVYQNVHNRHAPNRVSVMRENRKVEAHMQHLRNPQQIPSQFASQLKIEPSDRRKQQAKQNSSQIKKQATINFNMKSDIKGKTDDISVKLEVQKTVVSQQASNSPLNIGDSGHTTQPVKTEPKVHEIRKVTTPLTVAVVASTDPKNSTETRKKTNRDEAHQNSVRQTPPAARQVHNNNGIKSIAILTPRRALNETELAARESERFEKFAQLQKLYRNGSRIVVVPSVYKEYIKHDAPQWASNITIHEKYNYTTFVYQKLNASLPNYIATNRGTEGGIYLRYIVDHYHNFPDIAVFVHADPVKHSPNWLNLIGCISPNATFSNINLDSQICTTTAAWNLNEIWVEQCWRDVLRIAWNVSDTAELNKLVPIHKPVFSCGTKCCQQFIMSRAQVHLRPLSVWKQLLFMIGEQDVCHAGEPDYENLNAYRRDKQKVGPEPSIIPNTGDIERKITPGKHGVLTQGGAMEHLAHVVFGHQPLNGKGKLQNNAHYCSNYLPRSMCPGSPCKR